MPVIPLRTELLDAPADVALARVRATRVELAPGAASGAHRHPCEVVGWILAGRAVYEREGAAPQLLQTGDAFAEPKDVVVLRFDNASAAEPLVFTAVYLLEAGVEHVIEMLGD